MWSAEEVLNRGYKTAALPDFGGQKGFAPTGEPQEQATLKRVLNEYEQVIHEERITRKLNLSVGHWDEQRQMALVDVIKGSHFHHLGMATRIGNKNGYLMFPEEALFLLDQGFLELYLHDLPLSLEEAYDLILPILPSFAYYQVYAYLSRLGYVVTRYKKKCERKINEVHRACSGEVTAEQNEDNLSKYHCGEEETACPSDDNDVMECLEPMISGYVGNLWEGEAGERPLVRPSDATCTAAVLAKLQILKPLKLKLSDYESLEVANNYEISFDVYASKSGSKTDRLIDKLSPDYRVIVCRFSDPPPSLKEISRLTSESDPIHLKIGVVDQSNVSFIGVFGIDLPTLISLG